MTAVWTLGRSNSARTDVSSEGTCWLIERILLRGVDVVLLYKSHLLSLQSLSQS